MVKEIKTLLKGLTKKEIKQLIKLAEKELNSSVGIGDIVTLTINYMIGDSNGDTIEEYELEIKTQEQLDALNIVTHILDKHTKPNKGAWGFSLNEESFSKKPDPVYNLLYNQGEAPKVFNGIKITPVILETISEIEESCFRDETEYSFLVYQGYELSQ